MVNISCPSSLTTWNITQNSTLFHSVLLISLSNLQSRYHYCFSKTFSNFHWLPDETLIWSQLLPISHNSPLPLIQISHLYPSFMESMATEINDMDSTPISIISPAGWKSTFANVLCTFQHTVGILLCMCPMFLPICPSTEINFSPLLSLYSQLLKSNTCFIILFLILLPTWKALSTHYL